MELTCQVRCVQPLFGKKNFEPGHPRRFWHGAKADEGLAGAGAQPRGPFLITSFGRIGLEMTRAGAYTPVGQRRELMESVLRQAGPVSHQWRQAEGGCAMHLPRFNRAPGPGVNCISGEPWQGLSPEYLLAQGSHCVSR